MAIVIDKNVCPQTHKCPLVNICPVGAISQEGFSLPVVDHEKCIQCGACVDGCGMNAVYLNE